jgi:hypothetical protein
MYISLCVCVWIETSLCIDVSMFAAIWPGRAWAGLMRVQALWNMSHWMVLNLVETWGKRMKNVWVYSVYPQKTGIWLDLTYETGGINTYIYIYTFVCFQQILGGHLKVTARAVMELLSCWFKIVGGWSWPKSLIPIEYSRVLPVFSDVRSSLQLFELSEVRFFLMFVTVKQTILDSTGCCPFTTRLSGRTC